MTYKKLSEIADVFTGVRISRYTSDENTQPERIFQSKIRDNKLKYDIVQVGTKIDDKYYSRKNDIIIHLLNFKRIYHLKNENIIIPSNYAIIRVKEGYDSNYIYHILRSNQFNHVKERISEGTTINVLKLNHLKNIKIKVFDQQRQKTYGKTLDLIDKRIQIKEKQLEIEIEYKNEMLSEILGGRYVKL